MKKLFIPILAALILCTGLSQFAFAAEDIDPDKRPASEQIGEGQDKKPSQFPKDDDEYNDPVPIDFVNGPEGDGN